MTAQPPQPSATDSTPSLALGRCDDCGATFDLTSLDPHASQCAPCFERYLHGLEAPFLENYAQFGAKAHRTVAEALFRSLALADPDDRKIMGMRIVEEYLGASAELIGLFLALRRHDGRPVVESFLNFRLDASSVADYRRLVDGRDAETLMRELRLPTLADVDAARRDVPRRQHKQFSAAVRSVPAGLERVLRVEHGALLRLADGLTQSKTLAHSLAWIPDRTMDANQVALLVLDRQRRELSAFALTIHEPQLQIFIDAIDGITTAARDLIWLYLHMRDTEDGWDQSRRGSDDARARTNATTTTGAGTGSRHSV